MCGIQPRSPRKNLKDHRERGSSRYSEVALDSDL